MKIKLLRDARIRHQKGETVEVSPLDAKQLIALGSAEPVAPRPKKAQKKE